MPEEKKYTLTASIGLLIVSVFIVPLFVLLMMPFTIWEAFVATKLWAWFIIPYFQLPALPLWEMIGLFYFIGCFKSGRFVKGEERDWKSSFVVTTIGPGLVLAISYFIRTHLL